jgi:malate dehydrogenase
MAAQGQSAKVIGTCDYEDTANSDVVIITAGVPRKDGMSRDDLLKINADVIKTVAEGVKQHSPNAFVIVITNPLDAMVYAFQKHSGLPENMVVGMAGVLDTARFKHFLANELQIADSEVNTMVLGGHGDTMVPVISCTSINGIPLSHFLEQGLISYERLEAIIQRTRDGGAEIVKLLQIGSAFYAPAVAAITMMKSYLFNKKMILPCAAHLNGEYGLKNIYVGVPAVIGMDGVSKIIEVDLNASEKAQFSHSVEAVKSLIDALDKFE